jgi:uncharacterized membrane protein
MQVSYPDEKVPILFFFIATFDAIWFSLQTKLKLYPIVENVKYEFVLAVWIVLALYLSFLRPESALEAMIWGGIFGFSTYAVFNLTELAINSKWTVFTASVDMIWGTVNCASSSIIAERIAKRGLFWYMFLFLDLLVMFVLLFRAKIKCGKENDKFVFSVS